MVSLRKAFEAMMKHADKGNKIHSEFSKAISNSKYTNIEIPDDVVDVIDYGYASMTYERFIERLDEELEDSKDDS